MRNPDTDRSLAADHTRDDATALTALRLARRGPLIVTGLAGVGKSWLLRRIAALVGANKSHHFDVDGEPHERPLGAAPFAAVELHDGARKHGAALLAARLEQPDPQRLLIIDALEALILAGGPVLDAIACHQGPLIVAAPPAIGELAAALPGLQAFLTRRCRSLVLSPLSPPERRALLFSTAAPGAAIPRERAPLALDPAWGGHPRVLEQVRAVLCDPTEASLARLGDAVSDRLPGYAAAIVASLPTLEREALLAVAHGKAIGEPHRGAALSLVLHGALVRRSDGWSLADRVLERQIGASA